MKIFSLFIFLILSWLSFSQTMSETFYDGLQPVELYLNPSSGFYETYDPVTGIEVLQFDELGKRRFRYENNSVGNTLRLEQWAYKLGLTGLITGEIDKVRFEIENTNGIYTYKSKNKELLNGINGSRPFGTLLNSNTTFKLDLKKNGFFNDENLYLSNNEINLSIGQNEFTFPNLDTLTYTVSMKGNPELDLFNNLILCKKYFDSIFTLETFDVPEVRYITDDEKFHPSLKTYSANNAYAINFGSDKLIFGGIYNAGISLNPQVDLDIVAHEYAHFITNLFFDYNDASYFSAGVNEGLADMFSSLIERRYSSNDYWEFGERINWSGIPHRIYSTPTFYKGSAGYSGEFQYQIAEVLDYWFYLLSKPLGSTTSGGNFNNGFNYTIDAIGDVNITNLLVSVVKNIKDDPALVDFTSETIEQAKDLFGYSDNRTIQIKNAFVAVGLLPTAEYNSSLECPVLNYYTSSSGTIYDGSGTLNNYSPNFSCSWNIVPYSTDSIHLSFERLNIHSTDTLYIYDGNDSTAPLLASFTGQNFAPSTTFISNSNEVFVSFVTDNSGFGTGWEINYEGINAGGCQGELTLNNTTGTISDNTNGIDYLNNSECGFLITPPGCDSIDFYFNTFNLETNDTLYFYKADNDSLLDKYSGNIIPANLTLPYNSIRVFFSSDNSNANSGFDIAYSAYSSPFCDGTSVTETSQQSGLISDGSGIDNYYNNTDCFWRIAPTNATGVIAQFNSFNLFDDPTFDSDNNDWIAIYDGDTIATNNLLAKYDARSIPQTIYSSTGKLFIHFHTDNSESSEGWELDYSSSTGDFCFGTQVLTVPSGDFGDGSLADSSLNNTICGWLINPPNASSIILKFNDFDTEQNLDGIKVYDGTDENGILLGEYTGNNFPDSIYGVSGALFVKYTTNDTIKSPGWDLSYYSNIISNPLDGYSRVLGYKYWFDNDVTGLQYMPIPPAQTTTVSTNLDSDNLPNGFHTAHIMFLQDNGFGEDIVWSSPYSRAFEKVSEFIHSDSVYLSGYEYWFNSDTDSRIFIDTTGITGTEIVDNLYTNNLETGYHTLHVRFRQSNDNGNGHIWSSIFSKPFEKTMHDESNVITNYRYCFNSNFNNWINITLTPGDSVLNLMEDLQTCHLDTGLNVVHFQFMDSLQLWGSIYTDTFALQRSVLESFDTVNLCTGQGYVFPDGSNMSNIDSSFTQISILPSLISICDSTIYTHIDIDSSYHFLDTTYLCEGDTFYFQDGTELIVLQNELHISSFNTISGCDSIFSEQLIIFPTFDYQDTLNVCEGDSIITMQGTILYDISNDTIIYDNYTAIHGCDSSFTSIVNVFQNYNQYDTTSICANEVISWQGQTFLGLLNDTNLVNIQNSINGCDSILNMHVIVNPISSVSQFDTICFNSSFLLPDQTILDNNVSDTIIVTTLNNIFGCDSLITTHLEVRDVIETISDQDICEGSDFISADGVFYPNLLIDTTITSSLMSVNGCDSVVIENVFVSSIDTTYIKDTICSYESLFVNGQYVSGQGIHFISDQSSQGCDSVVQLELFVQSSQEQISQSHDSLFLLGNYLNISWLSCPDYVELGFYDSYFVPAVNGEYTAIVESIYCIDTLDCFNLNSLAINEEKTEFSDIRIYPNPSSTMITIESISKDLKFYNLEMIDELGKIIIKQTFKSKSIININIVKEKLTRGVYTLRLNHGTIIKKVIVQ